VIDQAKQQIWMRYTRQRLDHCPQSRLHPEAGQESRNHIDREGDEDESDVEASSIPHARQVDAGKDGDDK
jgi:hypothetical protein